MMVGLGGGCQTAVDMTRAGAARGGAAIGVLFEIAQADGETRRDASRLPALRVLSAAAVVGRQPCCGVCAACAVDDADRDSG